MAEKHFIVRPYRPGEETIVAEAHQRVYREEYQWGPAFGNYAKKVALDFARKPKNSREELWVAEKDGVLIGCIMLVEGDTPEIGQIRLFLVEKPYRKLGVGTALTDALMQKVRDCGYRQLVLWTADVLTAARRHYGKMGFHCVESVPNTTWSLNGACVQEEKWIK